MTTHDFRRIALSFLGAEELNGLGYPIFRIGRKTFATIEDSMGVIRFTRDQQATFVAAAPEIFAPVSGGWGRFGSTVVRLEVADAATVEDALATAWRNVTEVASVVDAADMSNAAEAPGTADIATVVSVEPYDHLKSVIERLQACW
jgi:hypothetical protein